MDTKNMWARYEVYEASDSI